MDTSETYIKMCNCEEIQGQVPTWEMTDFYGQRVLRKNGEIMGYEFPGPWLPRQDQIQEMMLGINKYWERIFPFMFNERLFFWNKKHGIQGEKTSMEQLWLAFYMHEKHGKVWDGDKWE